jgi:N-methylhydantoinase B
MDDNGVSDDPVEFEVAVEVEGSSVLVDYTAVPDQQPGPINCPYPSTVSGGRIAIALLAGGGEAPNEGHFRALEVRTRPGSLFHPVDPAPCYLYAWPTILAIEVIYRALAVAMPEAVPACSVGDIAGLTWWGVRSETGTTWADGSPHPVGQGAHSRGDGANSLMHVSEAATRLPPTEVWESRNPWIVEELELAADSGGAGEFRGGLGVNISFRMREDSFVTSTVERTRNPSWGLAGGEPGRPNAVAIRHPDGDRCEMRKATRLAVPRDAAIELRSGGGGGFGDPARRTRDAVLDDLRNEYITESFARRHFPHAFEGSVDE